MTSLAIGMPWRSVHPQAYHVTIRPKLSVHPTNRLLWQFTTVTFFHLYDPSTPASRWMVGHMWHNVHPPQNALWHNVHPFLKRNLDSFSHDFWTHLWCFAGCLAKYGRFVTGFFNKFVMSKSAFQRNVDILSHDFWTFVMPATCAAKCGCFVTGFFWAHLWVQPAFQQNVDVLSHDF